MATAIGLTTSPLDRKNVLHVIRNPYGYSEDQIREARLAAADIIVDLEKSHEQLHAFCAANGVDSRTQG